MKFFFIIFIPLSIFLFSNCLHKNINTKKIENKFLKVTDFQKVFTLYSQLENKYSGFNSVTAHNKIAEIENSYFRDYYHDLSKYYGTLWGENTLYCDDSTGVTIFDKYKSEIKKRGQKADSSHCTIYAIWALEAGFGDDFENIVAKHKAKWGKREFAGWSIGYILTTYYKWKAYLFISEFSDEYNRCVKNFNSSKTYYVWKQPSIKIENMYIFGKNDSLMLDLLNKNEFGWGFSYQGIHTWITRFYEIKECIWSGAPSKDFGSSLLFATHSFSNLGGYNSHIVVFPPTL